ncbi:MAG TPA: YceI family protein [Solirubrobacteraceae bacterium]|nr:YceI family protein [Solirubrobacteraceae bacterium]
MSITTEQIVPAGTWQLDPVHSKATFAVKHSGIATFRGSFKELDGALIDGVLTGSVKVASVDVPVEQLVGHLQSPDFFDAERSPEISFRSTEITHAGDALAVTGELTMRGVTKTVQATGALAGPTQYLDGKDRIAVELTTVVDRTEFGINWNAPLPGGGQALGNDVTIVVELQLVKAEA